MAPFSPEVDPTGTPARFRLSVHTGRSPSIHPFRVMPHLDPSGSLNADQFGKDELEFHLGDAGVSRQTCSETGERGADRRFRLGFHEPARYRIKVQGWLPEGITDRYGGLRVEKERGDPITATLVGVLPDQGALIGVLVKLHEFHVTVLEIGVQGKS